MKHSMYIGKILGVKLYIHWTFIFLLGWIVLYSLHSGISTNAFLWMVGLTIATFGCIIIHELGHAMVAKYFGIATNHITLLPVGGISQLESIPDKPREELFISLAGPASNLLLAALLLPFIDGNFIEAYPAVNFTAPRFLFSLMVLNLWLGAFNLTPAFPMDGGRVLRALLAFRMGFSKSTKIVTALGQIIGVMFFFSGFFYNVGLMFIGIVIFIAGDYESSVVQTAQLLHSYTVRDVLMKDFPVMQSNSTLKQAGEILLTTQNRNFVVTNGRKAIGTISRDEILAGIQAADGDKMLQEVKKQEVPLVSLTTPLDEAWEMMQRLKTPLMIVGNETDVAGVVEEDNIVEFILLKTSYPAN